MENIANRLYLSTGIILLLGLLYLGAVIYQIVKKKRGVSFSVKNVYNYFLGFLVLVPILAAIYFFPVAFVDENFWLPSKLQYLKPQEGLIYLGIAILGFYSVTRATIFFPHKNEYYNIIPKLLFLSLFPGIATALNVMIISKYVSGNFNAKHLLFFFAVATFVYIVTVRISKRTTVSLGILITHRYNMLITNRIFKIPFRKYEQIKEGKIYTILNDDIRSIFTFSERAITIYTSIITLVVIQIYLFSISWASSLLLLGVIFSIMGLVVLMSPKIKKTGHIARLKRENFSNFISGLINGFKELVLHKVKIRKFQNDMEKSSEDFYKANQKFTNVGIDASLFSELSFTIAVGVSCLLFPLIFNLEKEVITSFVLAVLYLWGPVGVLVNGVPQISDFQVSRNRIKDFLEEANDEETILLDEKNEITQQVELVESIEVQDVCFNYSNQDEGINYGIGPINFVANKGELIFIIGGNGSGKTTFLKLLIGLYQPSSGSILINGKRVNNKVLSECFSVIYSDFYLFEKLYDLNEDRLGQVNEWLKVLQLSDKVKIENGVFSTINLSKGQRKRLSILKSYLEDRPVYFFDEVAADLDPAFRDFFYNKLLVKMREEGKILIIISHDDKYFDVADNIYKMDMGQISSQQKELLTFSEQF